MPLYTTTPVRYLSPVEAGADEDVQFGRGPAYWLEENNTWWAQADFTSEGFSTNDPMKTHNRLHFNESSDPKYSGKGPETVTREHAVWEARGKGLNPGELICLQIVDHIPKGYCLGLRKSSYPEHHSSYIFRDKPDVYPGVGPDEYTSQFLPFAGWREKGAVCSFTHSPQFPSFALSFLMEADGQFVIPLRGKAVDQYAGVPSLFSGGRIDGKPHAMVDSLVYSSAPAPIFGHTQGLLQREIGGDTDALDRERIPFLQLTGLQRASDLDTTLSGWGTLDYTLQEIESCMRTHNMLAPEGAKYTGLMAVPATSDGVVRLLGMPFPPTVLPVVVYAALEFGVNPQDVLPGLTIIGE